MRFNGRREAFTVIELAVTAAIIGTISTLAVTMIQQTTASARSAECIVKMRAISSAIHLYCNEYNGEFPRTFHSAGAHRQPGWSTSIYPYFGMNDAALDEAAFNRFFRCPSHKETNLYIYSYALNVHFELDPQGDDYAGAPQTWRRMQQVPLPSRTLLLAECKPVTFGDHLMCHQWSGVNAAKNALAHERHQGKSNFLFVDGHVETLPPEQTINPTAGVNLWNPSLAR